MANPQTAAEWKQVVDNAQAQIVAVNQQKAQGEEQITALEQQLLANGQQISDYLLANPRITSKDPGLLALEAQTNTIKQNLSKTEVYVRATLTSQLFQLRATINNANRQAGVASSGPPNVNENTPPETVVPNESNTTVTTDPATPIDNSTTPPITDPAQARQQAILDEANAEIQAEPAQLSVNSDPNLNFNEGAVEGTRAEMQRQAELQAIERQEAEAQQIAEQQFIDQEPASAGGSGAYIENANPQFIGGEDPFEAARQRSEEEFNNSSARTEKDIFAAEGVTNAKGLQGKLNNARAQQITQDAENAKTQGDWRVRLSLAPSADYLYKAENPGILKYLQSTDGVIFPYTPQISVNYSAHYDPSDLTHSNYKIYQYKSSSVDQLSITCDFTAQDTFEANYLLAVIHFFRSVTKMFYGQDQLPKPGTPPPLCYLSGLGGFQFDRHPLVISSFNYSLPNDVDYIRAGSPTLQPGVDSTAYNGSKGDVSSSVLGRLGSSGLNTGAQKSAPQFTKATNTQPTYVPTKIQIALTAYPIVTRNDISNKFSLKEYATGSLLQGSRRNGGGIW